MNARIFKNYLIGFIKFWLPVLACMVFIFYFSSLPGKKIPPFFPFQDILFHLTIYIPLAYFFARALKNTYIGITHMKIIYLALAFGIIYGISDEIHQLFVPDRDASVFDLFIDGVGSFIGSLFYPVRKKISNGMRLSNGVYRWQR